MDATRESDATAPGNPFRDFGRPGLVQDAAGRWARARPNVGPGWALLTGACLVAALAALGLPMLLGAARPAWLIFAAMPVAGVSFLATLVLIGAHIAGRLNRKHLLALKRACDALGSELYLTGWMRKRIPEEDALFEPFAQLEELRTGVRGLRWIARADVDGREIRLLSHTYTSGAGEDRSTITQTAAACRVPDDWPRVAVSPENIATRIAAAFGGRDLDIDDPEFNKRFRVKTDDEDFAITLLSPSVQRWLVEEAKANEKNMGAIAALQRVMIGATESWYVTGGWLIRLSQKHVEIDEASLGELARRPVELLERSGLAAFT